MPIEMRHYLQVERAKLLLSDINIPSRPAILMKLLEEKKRSEVDLDRFDRIIGSDVALASGTLKVVNSPFFGLRQRVGSIPHAIRLLGTANVINIALGLKMQDAFRDQRGPFIEQFWETSGRLAAICTLVARMVRGVPPDEAYAVGLLADCGVPLLASRFADYAVIYEAAWNQNSESIDAYEEKHLGSNHTAAGYILAKNWKLPREFAECILRHHDSVNYYDGDTLPETKRLLAVLQLSLAIRRSLQEKPESREWEILKNVVRTYLKLDDEQYEALLCDARELG